MVPTVDSSLDTVVSSLDGAKTSGFSLHVSILGMRCYFCLEQLREPSLADLVEAEAEFRQNFPNSWMDNEVSEDKVALCNSCYERLLVEDPPADWERRNGYS